jgi:16S rRNA (cytosine967-C5)-methyltransferase
MIAPARVAAYHVLAALRTGRSDLASAIAAARRTLEDERDRALVADIATGVQRWRAALDHLIAVVSGRPLARLDPEIVDILRLSLYQLLYLTRVPAAAVVDDAVDLARRAGKTSASGFVNAVLRRCSRQRRSLPLPSRPSEPGHRDAALDYLSVTLSHPRWLASRWYDRFGLETAETWLRFNNAAAPLTLRANTLRASANMLRDHLARQGVVARPGRFAPEALIVESGNPLRDPGHARWFVVQDEASQLVALLAGERPGARLLDTCASPGNKTTAMAARMPPGGLVVACDVRERRVRLLRRTISAAGAENVRLVQADLRAPVPFDRSFDTVVVDAPCSGLGTLRRDPDIRWRRQEPDLQRLAAAELAMLRHASDGVRAGGRLVYATCSSEPEENEKVAEDFLRLCPDFAALDARQTHQSLPAAVIDGRGHLRTTPDGHGLEAFFGAVFVRTQA